MKKSYRLEELGCANCAQKMESAISKIDGVDEVKINFMTSKIRITADDEKFDDVLNLAQQEITKLERDCKIVF
ncbi:MAG: heavy-metal-associated domain-containing protein [Tissierellia bacterium]|nr:heavy-metal-associated domain-containing protein [Tissierellia bacterium]